LFAVDQYEKEIERVNHHAFVLHVKVVVFLWLKTSGKWHVETTVGNAVAGFEPMGS
jgi:hypothetical protein